MCDNTSGALADSLLWHNDTPVIIYGAGGKAVLAYNKFHSHWNIVGFIDRRAYEIGELCGLPVHAPDLSGIDIQLRRNALVIISVANVFDHENIVNYLIGASFRYIIFCPVESSTIEYSDYGYRDYLEGVFDDIFEKSIQLPIRLNNVANFIKRREYEDNTIIKADAENITAYIPAIYAFSRNSTGKLPYDSSLISLYYYYELYDYFDGVSMTTPASYMYFMAHNNAALLSHNIKTDAWARYVIEAKRFVYERMLTSFNLEPEFFRNNCVPAIWNPEKKHFNLVSGKHRNAFLIHKGSMYIPLAMTKADYDTYLNMPAVKKVLDYLGTANTNKLPYPIFHAYFAKAPYREDANFYRLLCRLAAALSKGLYAYGDRDIGLNDASAVDTTGMFYPVLRCISKLGCIAYRTYELAEFDLLLDDLYMVESSITDLSGCFDIAVVGSDSEHVSSKLYVVLARTEAEASKIAERFKIEELEILGRYAANEENMICLKGKANHYEP